MYSAGKILKVLEQKRALSLGPYGVLRLESFPASFDDEKGILIPRAEFLYLDEKIDLTIPQSHELKKVLTEIKVVRTITLPQLGTFNLSDAGKLNFYANPLHSQSHLPTLVGLTAPPIQSVVNSEVNPEPITNLPHPVVSNSVTNTSAYQSKGFSIWTLLLLLVGTIAYMGLGLNHMTDYVAETQTERLNVSPALIHSAKDAEELSKNEVHEDPIDRTIAIFDKDNKEIFAIALGCFREQQNVERLLEKMKANNLVADVRYLDNGLTKIAAQVRVERENVNDELNRIKDLMKIQDAFVMW